MTLRPVTTGKVCGVKANEAAVRVTLLAVPPAAGLMAKHKNELIADTFSVHVPPEIVPAAAIAACCASNVAPVDVCSAALSDQVPPVMPVMAVTVPVRFFFLP